MQPRQTPTSPAHRSQKAADAVAKVWSTPDIQQPLRIPWGGFVALSLFAAAVMTVVVLVGLGIIVHRYPNSWLTRWLPSTITTSTTTIVQSPTDSATPTAITAIQESAYGIAANQGQTGIYAASDQTGIAWPLNANGWMVTVSGAWPTDVKSLVVLPASGQAQSISTTVADPATTFMFLKTSEVSGQPLAFADSGSIRLGMPVWVVTQHASVARTLVDQNQPHWSLADHEPMYYILDADANAPIGSAVVDANGRLIGIFGSNGHVWPVAAIANVLNTILQSGNVVRVSLGLTGVQLDTATVAGQPSAHGYLVGAATGQTAVIPKSPADKAGIESGDIITAIDGQSLTTDLFSALSHYQPGDDMKVTLLRHNVTKTVTVKLGTLGS